MQDDCVVRDRPPVPAARASTEARRSLSDAPRPAPASPGPDDLELPVIPDVVLEHRPGEDRRDLIVVCSPSRRFILYRYAFPGDALFVSDLKGFYYLAVARKLARELVRFIDRGGYERVLFLGTSKGGFGALLLTRLCARLRPDRTFRALAFSPQVRLHPLNADLYFPSYRRLRRVARTRFAMRAALRLHGDVSRVADASNVHATVVYATDNPTDLAEANRLGGRNLRKVPIAGTSHGSILYFTLQGRPESYVRGRIARIYARAKRRGQDHDQDLFASRPKDPEQFLREIMLGPNYLPTLEGLLQEALAAAPRPLSAGERMAASVRRLAQIAGGACRGFSRERQVRGHPAGGRPARAKNSSTGPIPKS